MPWTKVLCPNGEEKTFEECLACTNECFDLEIRETLFEREQNWQDAEHQGSSITVSALIGCLRGIYLERIHDFAANPKDQWYSLRGELIHKIVERPDMDDPYKARTEMRLHIDVPINGTHLSISGRIDRWRQRFLEEGILKEVSLNIPNSPGLYVNLFPSELIRYI